MRECLFWFKRMWKEEGCAQGQQIRHVKKSEALTNERNAGKKKEASQARKVFRPGNWI